MLEMFKSKVVVPVNNCSQTLEKTATQVADAVEATQIVPAAEKFFDAIHGESCTEIEESLAPIYAAFHRVTSVLFAASHRVTSAVLAVAEAHGSEMLGTEAEITENRYLSR